MNNGTNETAVLENAVFLGIDEHENSIAVARGKGKEKSVDRTFGTTERDYAKFREWVEQFAQPGTPVYAAYEASQTGPRLARRLQAWGWTCYVIAPHDLPRSPKARRRKCDPEDARRILGALRGHVLAGNELAVCWLPDDQTMDDREIVRERLSLGEKITAAKNAIHSLCKRYSQKRPQTVGAWTCAHREWLRQLSKAETLKAGARLRLQSLLNQLTVLEQERTTFDKAIVELARQRRHRARCTALRQFRGVGFLVAMTYLVEMGDPRRFQNRRQIGAYWGLVPSSFESGESGERKGHITHQGSPRVRKVLSQAAWVLVRDKAHPLSEWYHRTAALRGSKRAIVGVMRQLAVRMWHKALELTG